MDEEYPETVTLTRQELEEIIYHAIHEYCARPHLNAFLNKVAKEWAQYAFDAKRKQNEL